MFLLFSQTLVHMLLHLQPHNVVFVSQVKFQSIPGIKAYNFSQYMQNVTSLFLSNHFSCRGYRYEISTGGLSFNAFLSTNSGTISWRWMSIHRALLALQNSLSYFTLIIKKLTEDHTTKLQLATLQISKDIFFLYFVIVRVGCFQEDLFTGSIFYFPQAEITYMLVEISPALCRKMKRLYLLKWRGTSSPRDSSLFLRWVLVREGCTQAEEIVGVHTGQRLPTVLQKDLPFWATRYRLSALRALCLCRIALLATACSFGPKRVAPRSFSLTNVCSVLTHVLIPTLSLVLNALFFPWRSIPLSTGFHKSIPPNKNPPAAKCFPEKSTNCEVLFLKIHQLLSVNIAVGGFLDFSNRHFAAGGFSLGGIEVLSEAIYFLP